MPKKLQEIRVGQKWRSRDRRDAGVLARVVLVDGCDNYGNGFVTVYRFRHSTMRAHTLRSRYTLVYNPPVATGVGAGNPND